MIPVWARWLLIVLCPVLFFASMTEWFARIAPYHIAVFVILLAFCAVIVWHAKRRTDGL